MVNALIRKLEGFTPLSDNDRTLLSELSNRAVSISADQPIILQGDAPSDVRVVLEGFAARSKTLRDGSQQIFAYLVPGDFCDLHVAVLSAMDHDIRTLTPCKVANISKKTVREIAETRPNLMQALWWCTLVDAATLREWLVNIGQRSAEERIAHLFCELHVRLKAVGLGSSKSFELPITQDVLAKTMGLSSVHVNRSLKELRERELVTFKSRVIKIPDIGRLEEYAEFDSSYLHLTRGPAYAEAHAAA